MWYRAIIPSPPDLSTAQFLEQSANRISLPDITISVVHYGISSWIFDNEDLAQTDNQIRTVSIQPFKPLKALTLRIRFQFTVLHDLIGSF